jgi:hypothetical protein
MELLMIQNETWSTGSKRRAPGASNQAHKKPGSSSPSNPGASPIAAGEEDFYIPAAPGKEEGVSLEEYEDASDEMELLRIQNET